MKKFKWITMVVASSVSYLGMQIDRWDNQFLIGMDFYVQKLLAPYDILIITNNYFKCIARMRETRKVNHTTSHQGTRISKREKTLVKLQTSWWIIIIWI
jgi:hypothetical protein